jgi:heat shock protein 1/8
MSALVLGVNFGATASSVAILTSNGQAEVIADDDGFRQIANAVSFTDEEEVPLLGQGLSWLR